MTDYIIRRLLLMIPTMLGITLVTFLIVQLAPGSPVAARLGLGTGEAGGEAITAETIAQMNKLYGLDKPIHERYLIWLGKIVRLDFGDSTVDNRPVLERIGERLPITLQLNIVSIALAYLIAVPLGAFAAVKRNSWFDHVTTLSLFILYSLPSFWVALMLILYLGSGEYLRLFPIYGINSPGIEFAAIEGPLEFGRWLADRAWHLVLPVFCLTYGSLASLSRFARVGMLDVVRQDYVRTARAKGLPEKIVLARHAFRNSVIPIITLLGTILPVILGGSVIVESIFSIPGMGQLAFDAVLSRDYPTIMGIATISAVLTLVGFLISDLLYVVADPRIRLQ